MHIATVFWRVVRVPFGGVSASPSCLLWALLLLLLKPWRLGAASAPSPSPRTPGSTPAAGECCHLQRRLVRQSVEGAGAGGARAGAGAGCRARTAATGSVVARVRESMTASACLRVVARLPPPPQLMIGHLGPGVVGQLLPPHTTDDPLQTTICQLGVLWAEGNDEGLGQLRGLPCHDHFPIQSVGLFWTGPVCLENPVFKVLVGLVTRLTPAEDEQVLALCYDVRR